MAIKRTSLAKSIGKASGRVREAKMDIFRSSMDASREYAEILADVKSDLTQRQVRSQEKMQQATFRNQREMMREQSLWKFGGLLLGAGIAGITNNPSFVTKGIGGGLADEIFDPNKNLKTYLDDQSQLSEPVMDLEELKSGVLLGGNVSPYAS